MQDAVKFMVQNPEDLKKILNLYEQICSSPNPLLESLLVSYKENKGMATAAPQNSDFALGFKIKITNYK